MAIDSAARAMAKMEVALAGMKSSGIVDIQSQVQAAQVWSRHQFCHDVGVFLSMRGKNAVKHSMAIMATAKKIRLAAYALSLFPKPS